MPTKRTAGTNFYASFPTHRENSPENLESNQWYKLLLLLMFSAWCPWPITDWPFNHLNVKQFSSSIEVNTNRNTNKLSRDIGWQK